MKKITKRIFSAILSAIMLILALPLTGFASDKIYTYKYVYRAWLVSSVSG